MSERRQRVVDALEARLETGEPFCRQDLIDIACGAGGTQWDALRILEDWQNSRRIRAAKTSAQRLRITYWKKGTPR